MQVGQIILLLPNTMAQTGLLAGVVLQVEAYLPAACESEMRPASPFSRNTGLIRVHTLSESSTNL